MSELTLVMGDKNFSSWSIRPYLALLLSGLPHRVEVVHLYGARAAGKAAKLAAASPTGKVPVLRWGDAVAWDSLAIVETLAELAPQAGLWPAAPAARAMARSVCAEMHAGFATLRHECSMNAMARTPIAAPSPGVLADVARLEALFASCRAAHGQGGPFLFGAFGAADCFFAPVVSRFVTYALPVGAATRAYMDAVLAHPIVARWLREAADEVAAEPA